MNLTELTRNIPAKIIAVDQADLKLALLRMGITPGAICYLSNEAPFGDPIAISVNETKVMMRKKDASRIEVKPI